MGSIAELQTYAQLSMRRSVIYNIKILSCNFSMVWMNTTIKLEHKFLWWILFLQLIRFSLKKKGKDFWVSMFLLQLKPQPLVSRIKVLATIGIKAATMERISKEILENACLYVVIVVNLVTWWRGATSWLDIHQVTLTSKKVDLQWQIKFLWWVILFSLKFFSIIALHSTIMPFLLH